MYLKQGVLLIDKHGMLGSWLSTYVGGGVVGYPIVAGQVGMDGTLRIRQGNFT